MKSAEIELQPPAVAPPPQSAGPSRFRRFFQWFWGGKAWRELREAERAVPAIVKEHRQRARAALALGRAALESTGGLDHGPFDAFAIQLFRQSLYWAARAREPESEAIDPRMTLSRLWDSLDANLLATLSSDAQRRDVVKAALLERDASTFAELAIEEQIRLGRQLADFADLVLNDDALTLKVERLWLKRMFRLALPVIVLSGIVVGTIMTLIASEDSRDLARGKPWVASSKWPEGGCTPPAQVCATSPDYFFSTIEEENPWIEFDLGEKRAVSSIYVKNRAEVPERAAPLVVEVSLDHVKWKEVARKGDEFRTLRQSFAKTEARWVRLRVPRKTFLHLLRVKIFG